jgi:hypothetical protein
VYNAKDYSKMNHLSFLVILISIATIAVHSHSPPIEYKTEVVNSDGVPVCSHEGVQIKKFETVNQRGRCRELFCDTDFNVVISDCGHDPSNRCHFEGLNYLLSYPDCCGIKVCS